MEFSFGRASSKHTIVCQDSAHGIAGEVESAQVNRKKRTRSENKIKKSKQKYLLIFYNLIKFEKLEKRLDSLINAIVWVYVCIQNYTIKTINAFL